MVGKARSFSDEAKEAVYEKQFTNEVYSAGAQQNSYNLGSVHFSDQSGIANISQAGTDQRKASIQGALFRGNVGFNLQTAVLDVGTFTIDLNVDGAGTVLSVISTDRIVTLSGGITGDLVTIDGPQRPGQRLFLYGIQGNTITIKNTAAATPNTILTPGGIDVVLANTDVVQLIFDVTTAKWRVVAGPGSGGGDGTGTFISSNLSVDQIANLAVGEHVEFDNDLPPKGAKGGITLQTGAGQANGIYELKKGKTYFLSTAVNPQFNAVNHIEFVWYDVTNATELGVRTKIDDATLAMNQPKNEIIYTPGLDVTVEVRIVAVTTPANLTGFDSVYSFAHIFELNASTAAGTGTYIASKMDQNQIANLALNNHIQFNDIIEDGGIVLQGQTPTFDQTSGIYELKAGTTYYLSAFLEMEFNANTDAAAINWFDITNAVNISQSLTSVPVGSAALATANLTTETIFTPVTDVTVELRITNLAGTINTVIAAASQANIFEFSGTTGEQGADGAPTWKLPARAKSTIDVPNLASADVIFDGITLVEDDRVLLTDQTTLSENGLYQVGVVAAGFAPLTRPSDFDTSSEVLAECFVAIEEGSTQANQLWHLISNNPLTIDVSDQVWDIFAPGTSGGPDMGGGEDGIDGAGQFVNDGRVAIGFDRLKRWEQLTDFPYPNNGVGDMIYLPSIFANPTTNGRIVLVGDSTQAKNSSYSDDYGSTFVFGAGPISSNDSYGDLAYDPVGNVLVCRSGNSPNTARAIQRSTDRGDNWGNTAYAGALFITSLIWSNADSQFVLCEGTATTVDRVWTSPDGNTWTQQTTPAAVLGGWFHLAYDEANGLYICKGNSATDVMTSPDAVTWTLGVTNISLQFLRTIIHSVGQDKFVALSGSLGTYHSQDGINWVQFNTFPNMISADDIIWAPDLSLWLVLGSSTQGGSAAPPIFWGSNDAETWFQTPLTTMRVNDEGEFGVGAQKSSLAYAEEWGYFFGVGGDATLTNPFTAEAVFWRTQVYFNNQLQA